jgi:protein-tyrosine kinase
MSRIFEALRRSLESGADAGPANPAERRPGPLEPQTPEVRARGFEGVEAVSCRVRPEGRIVSGGSNHDLGAEKFRLLCYRLNQMRRRRALSRVTVTSCIPKEGKTVTAVNLAVSLARSFARVALVDADLRQPGISEVLGLGARPGMGEFLEGRIELERALCRVEPLGVHYLGAGKPSGNPFELLQSARMRELIQRMTPAFDWIIFDSPPLVPFADAHSLGVLTDTVLLVVRPGYTPRDILRRTLAGLEGIDIAGIVWNASDDLRHDRYYYRSYEQGLPDKNELTRLLPESGDEDQ